jgi:hypothetical protein
MTGFLLFKSQKINQLTTRKMGKAISGGFLFSNNLNKPAAFLTVCQAVSDLLSGTVAFAGRD